MKMDGENKVLVSPTTFGDEPLKLLESRGYVIIRNNFGRVMTPEEVASLGGDCVGIVAGVELINSRVLDSITGLRCISRCGVGMENIDLAKTKELGITVVNTPDSPTNSVAELTLCLILCAMRGVSYCDSEIKSGKWTKVTGSLLKGKIVGIIGVGRIGLAVSQLLSALGVTVIGHDIKMADDLYSINLNELLLTSDVVSIHASTDSCIIGRDEIDKMKFGSYLINMSRGIAVDEEALYEALKSDHLAGAALDVFEHEPYSGKLIELNNVVLTPHIGSYTKECRIEMELAAVKNLLEVLDGH